MCLGSFCFDFGLGLNVAGFVLDINSADGLTVNRYVYDIDVIGSSYKIVVETDGVISSLSRTNYSLSIAWEDYGTSENITMPKTMNNTSIKIALNWWIGGAGTPQIGENDTHYFVSPMNDSMGGGIVFVWFGEPQIEMDLSAPTIALGYYVNITGRVTYKELPKSSEYVYVGWIIGGPPNDISYGVTSSDGTFSVSWIPSATGTFYIVTQIKCYWLFDEIPEPSSSACLSISPSFEEQVFSVVSNSTISSLALNSTAYALSFSASGPTGTNGYAKVFISKELVTSISDLRVYVDGNLTEYTLTSNNNSWVVRITYSHSTHDVHVVIPEFPSATILTAFMALTILAVALTKKNRSRRFS